MERTFCDRCGKEVNLTEEDYYDVYVSSGKEDLGDFQICKACWKGFRIGRSQD